MGSRILSIHCPISHVPSSRHLSHLNRRQGHGRLRITFLVGKPPLLERFGVAEADAAVDDVPAQAGVSCLALALLQKLPALTQTSLTSAAKTYWCMRGIKGI